MLGFDDVESFDVIGEEVIYGLFVLVEVVLNVLDDYEDFEKLEVYSNEELFMIMLCEFSEYLDN